jgi:5S rRNA maturation endonuclease (ribonuclease M5)
MIININSINITIVKYIDVIFNYFGLDYKLGRNRIILACPIHNSDNDISLNLFTEGDTKVGNFVCWTNHCEKEIGFGAFNLVKYLLDEKIGKKHSFQEVANFIQSITGSEFKKITVEEITRKKFSTFVVEKKISSVPTITRNKVRINLKIPAEYYIKRGYSKEILNRYDIGFCYKKQDELFMRTVVPVYNEEFKLIGKLGRSTNSQCIICEKYHDKNKACPQNDLEKRWASKWINSQGFKTGECFYNLWYAADLIRSSQTVILVEGCGDVLRLEESGIHNSLGLFGLELTDTKLEILNKLGVMNLILALDNDPAGREARDKIYNQTLRYFNTSVLNIGNKDIGDTPISEVKKLFK